jgi:hypothetical protein
MSEHVPETGAIPYSLRRRQLLIAGHYLGLATVLNLVWELGQLPLYTIWITKPLAYSLFAAVHCTIGDFLIAAITLILAVLLTGHDWPRQNFWRVAGSAALFGIAYTICSEWWNVEVRGTWAYAMAMPRLPWIGTGLSPLAQWIVVPIAGFALIKMLHSLA